MKVGLDIDNVVSMFDDGLFEELLLFDKGKKNRGIINPNVRMTRGMFDLTRDEIDEFYCNNMERIAKKLEVNPKAKKYIDKLLKDGNEVYLISHRAHPHYQNPLETTINWLKEKNINYTKLILSKSTDKSSECIQNGIDVFFDDVYSNCKNVIAKGIRCYQFETKYNKKDGSDVLMVKDFEELYNVVCNLRERHIILDTDLYNEVDDQFALTYLLKSLDKFKLDAITIAPFSNSGYAKTNSISEGTDKSYEVTLKILDMLDMPYKDIVYKGATSYSNQCVLNEATDKIIEIAHQNAYTEILAIGAITNIGLAIRKDRSIIPKIKVIWLGGNSFLSNNNDEFNFRQDIMAVREVFESKVELVIIPCRNVASNLVTTKYELENYLLGSEIGNYLCEIFSKCKSTFMKEKIDYIGLSKTLWDLSVIAYLINEKWFVTERVSCPIIKEDGTYEKTTDRHKVTFVNDLFRNKIFQDFFVKVMSDKAKVLK